MRSEGSAQAYYFGTLEETRPHAAFMAEQVLLAPRWAEVAISAAERVAMAAEWRAWGERPDAFFLNVRCQAVGWVSDVK